MINASHAFPANPKDTIFAAERQSPATVVQPFPDAHLGRDAR
jgi:hypothetical protein